MNAVAKNLDLRLARGVIDLSLPLMGTMAGNLLMMLVDRICLARYSIDTLAASGPAVFTAMSIIALFTATANISRSCVAQAFGRSGEAAAGYEAFLGVIIGGALALLLLAMSPLIGMIPTLSSRPEHIVALESRFLVLAAGFGAVMVLNISLASYFNGVGRTKVTLRVALVGQVVAAVMIYGLVFGRFGLPEMGMRGSALGTLAGTSSMLACYLWLLPKGLFRAGLKHWRAQGWPLLLAQLAFRLRRGIASGFAAGSDELGNTAFVWLAALLGPIALAANNVNLTLNYLAIIPIIGLGVGCSVLCGNALGRNAFDEITHILRATLIVEGIYVLIVTLFQVLIPDLLLRPFGLGAGDTQMLQAATGTARVLWTYSVSFMFSMTGAAVLESFGLTRFILVTRLTAMWGMSIPLIYLTALRSGDNPGNLPVIWIIGSVFELAIGAIYFWRILKAARQRLNYLDDGAAGRFL